MSRIIRQFDLGNTITSELELPKGAEFCHAGIDGEGKLSVWMQIDDEFSDLVRHTFGVFNTENPIPDDWTYLESIHVGTFVLHVHHYDFVTPVVVDTEESDVQVENE